MERLLAASASTDSRTHVAALLAGNAGLRRGGRVHILRHTFCSRLAVRNVPILSIRELAGHQSLETTMRYMHLASAAPRAGIKALEGEGRSGQAPRRR